MTYSGTYIRLFQTSAQDPLVKWCQNAHGLTTKVGNALELLLDPDVSTSPGPFVGLIEEEAQERLGARSRHFAKARWSLGGFDVGSDNPRDADVESLNQWRRAIRYNPGSTEANTANNILIYRPSLPSSPADTAFVSFPSEIHQAAIQGALFLISSPIVHRSMSDLILYDEEDYGLVRPFLSKLGKLKLQKFPTDEQGANNGIFPQEFSDDLIRYTADIIAVSKARAENLPDDVNMAEVRASVSLADVIYTLTSQNNYPATLMNFSSRNKSMFGRNPVLGLSNYPQLDSWAVYNIFLIAEVIHDNLVRRNKTDVLYKALRFAKTDDGTPLMTEGQISLRNTYRYQRHTCFVRNFFTYRYLDKGTDRFAEGSRTDPEYNYYNKSFEEGISGSAIPEAVIPNNYIYSIYSAAEASEDGVPRRWSPPPPGGDPQQKIDSGRNYLTNYYKPILDLESSISDLSNSNSSVKDYLRAYSAALPQLSGAAPGDDEQTKSTMIQQKVQNLIVPASDLNLLKNVSTLMPMGIKIRMMLESPGPASNFLNNLPPVNNQQSPKVSSYMLEGLRSVYSSEDIVVNEGSPTDIRAIIGGYTQIYPITAKQRSKYVTTPVRRTSITNLLDFGSGDDGPGTAPIESLVITETGADALTGNPLPENARSILPDDFRQFLRGVASERYLKYGQFCSNNQFSLNSTPSEAIAYRLVKYDSDRNIIQNIYIANGEDQQTNRMFEYMDTQVKYNKEYQYELYEYRLVYSSNYSSFVLPSWVDSRVSGFAQRSGDPRTEDHPRTNLGGSKNHLDVGTTPAAREMMTNLEVTEENKGKVAYDVYSMSSPEMRIYEVPVYNETVFRDVVERGAMRSSPNTPNGLFYNRTKVMDYPPAPPELVIHPLQGNYRQLKIGASLNVGNYTFNNALRVYSIGDREISWNSLFRYQKTQEYFPLQSGRLQFKNESPMEITKVKFYRTTNLNLEATTLQGVYQSFNPNTNPDVVTRTLTQDSDSQTDAELVRSYDFMDTLDTNTYYYYTCVSEDVHGNISNPSIIMSVRLTFEHGTYIPEIKPFHFKPIDRKVPTRKFARFIQIEPSDLQSMPINEENDDGDLVGIRSVASQRGLSISGENLVVRLTSRDTGRKFDIKVSFSDKDIND